MAVPLCICLAVERISRQCGQCQRPDCPVLAMDSPVPDAEPETDMVDQPFAASEMGQSMDADLLPESGCEEDTPTQWSTVVDYDPYARRNTGGSNVRC